MEEVKRYLRSNGVRVSRIEGSASQAELDYLYQLTQSRKAKHILEIGFNAGYSAYTFLSANPDAHVTSFDIGDHPYTKLAKQFIDEKFPNRHELILGNSLQTVPGYKTSRSFDLAFIDGGHAYRVAKADLQNVRRLCTSTTAVVMDDLVPWLYWGIGPTLAWKKMLNRGQLRQAELYQDGRAVPKVKFPAHRVWALGFYVGIAD